MAFAQINRPTPRRGHGHAVGVDLVHAPYTSEARVDDRLVHRERGGLLIIKIADVALHGVRIGGLLACTTSERRRAQAPRRWRAPASSYVISSRRGVDGVSSGDTSGEEIHAVEHDTRQRTACSACAPRHAPVF